MSGISKVIHLRAINRFIAPTKTMYQGLDEYNNVQILRGLPTFKSTHSIASEATLMKIFKHKLPILINQMTSTFCYFLQKIDLFSRMKDGNIPREFTDFILSVAILSNRALTYNFECGHYPTFRSERADTLMDIFDSFIRSFDEGQRMSQTVPHLISTYYKPLITTDSFYTTGFVPLVTDPDLNPNNLNLGIYLTDKPGRDHTYEPMLFPKLEYLRQHDITLSTQYVNIKLPDNYFNVLLTRIKSLKRVIDLLSNQMCAVATAYKELGDDNIVYIDILKNCLCDIIDKMESKNK